MVYSIASSFYQLELALLPLGVPVKSGHINKSVQATHITLDEQTRAVFVLDMGSKASILLVLLGADNAVKLPVVTKVWKTLPAAMSCCPALGTPAWPPSTVALAARLASRI